MLNLKPKELVLYLIIVYILRYVIYFILDYVENYGYKKEEQDHSKLQQFNLMNKIIDGGKNILVNTGLIENNKEGFQTYQQCRNLGYSKEFCVQTPTSVFGPAGCMCPDGTIGATYPGLRGGCLCSNNNIMLMPRMMSHINYY